MVMSLITVTVLSLLAVTIYRVTRSQVRESVYQMRLAQAHAIAEAGLEDALHMLYQNPNWRVGFKNKSFAGGRCTVTLSADNPPWVLSTGYSQTIYSFGPAVKTVRGRALFQLGPGSGCSTTT